MIDRPLSDSGSSFVRALVASAKSDVPDVGAKARALAQLSGPIWGGATASAITNGVARASLVRWGLAGALAFAGAGVGVGWTLRGQPVSPAATKATTAPWVAAETPATAVAPAASVVLGVSTVDGAALAHRLKPASVCATVAIPDRSPTVCSVEGRSEPLELVNTCGEAVDVYWVDYKCRETIAGTVAPGETWKHNTFDTHPWRVRDHATHRLIKEWVGPRQPDIESDASDGKVHLPDVSVTDDSSAKDGAPTACSRNSREASLRFVNQRTHGVSVVFWVDYDCHEQVYRRLEPGETWESLTHEAHPWRVRDETGLLLVDFHANAANAVDYTVFVSLP
jgi:VHL beta domain